MKFSEKLTETAGEVLSTWVFGHQNRKAVDNTYLLHDRVVQNTLHQYSDTKRMNYVICLRGMYAR